ncbi:MAG TPA: GTPase RsgA, partial [Roseateles sp.]|nr:GTPase RsgA [Roseateles sp.]
MLETLDIEALRALGLNLSMLSHVAGLEAGPATRLWRVTEVQRDRLSLQSPTGACRARLLPALQQQLFADGEQLAVGDWVLADTQADQTWVQQRVPPLNMLSRRDPEGHRQALVSNVDTALLVMGLDHDFKLARLDRYLVLTRAAGVASVVVLSKADLCRDVEARLAEVEDHLAHSRRSDGGVMVVLAVDGTQATTRARLAPWLGP